MHASGESVSRATEAPRTQKPQNIPVPGREARAPKIKNGLVFVNVKPVRRWWWWWCGRGDFDMMACDTITTLLWMWAVSSCRVSCGWVFLCESFEGVHKSRRGGGFSLLHALASQRHNSSKPATTITITDYRTSFKRETERRVYV